MNKIKNRDLLSGELGFEFDKWKTEERMSYYPESAGKTEALAYFRSGKRNYLFQNRLNKYYSTHHRFCSPEEEAERFVKEVMKEIDK